MVAREASRSPARTCRPFPSLPKLTNIPTEIQACSWRASNLEEPGKNSSSQEGHYVHTLQKEWYPTSTRSWSFSVKKNTTEGLRKPWNWSCLKTSCCKWSYSFADSKTVFFGYFRGSKDPKNSRERLQWIWCALPKRKFNILQPTSTEMKGLKKILRKIALINTGWLWAHINLPKLVQFRQRE